MCIKGGYILQPRAIDESEISSYPPHVREIWLYLLRKAYYKETRIQGRVFNRGQLLTSYADIINDLSWSIGWRKMSYKPHQCETAAKLLTKAGMITARRTTRGMVVTITKYDFYQAKENYENLTGSDTVTAGEPQENRTIFKERKKERSNINTSVGFGSEKLEEDIRLMFNSCCPSFAKLKLMSKGRKEKLTVRLEEMEAAGVSIEDVFKKMEASDFMKGGNKHAWEATFDWLMANDKNWLKVIEGNYDNKSATGTNNPNDIWKP